MFMYRIYWEVETISQSENGNSEGDMIKILLRRHTAFILKIDLTNNTLFKDKGNETEKKT